MSSETEVMPHRIVCHLEDVLADRQVTLTELSRRTGITMANLSILKTNKARAIRFTTLTDQSVAHARPPELGTQSQLPTDFPDTVVAEDVRQRLRTLHG